MSDHLPECCEVDQPGYGTWWCICEWPRACEQRVLEDERALIAVEQTTLAELNAEYRKGLDAAREAVAGVAVRKDTSHDMRVQALAAIDALRTHNP